MHIVFLNVWHYSKDNTKSQFLLLSWILSPLWSNLDVCVCVYVCVCVCVCSDNRVSFHPTTPIHSSNFQITKFTWNLKKWIYVYIFVCFYKNYASPLSLCYKFTSDEMNHVEVIVYNTLTWPFLPKRRYKNTFLHTKREAKKNLQLTYFSFKMCVKYDVFHITTIL